MVKVRRAEMFLFNGNKVKVTLMFRIRELEHPEFGFEAVQRLVEAVAHIGVLDSKPKLQGRAITAMLSPVAQAKRKLVHNSSPLEDDDLGDEEDVGDEE
jgi:translation initiation factor IF-3